MDEPRMGSWRHPPLAYVVAEIRISPFYKLEEHVPDFQAEVRDKFPRTREATVLRVELQAKQQLTPIPERAWRFFSENLRIGIDLAPRNLSLHATEYRDFSSFSESLKLVLSAAEKTIPNLFVEQLGLRYIDYILPAQGETGFDYVDPSVRGLVPPGAGAPSEAYWIGHYPLDKGGVNLRVIPVMPSGSAQPPNFGPIEVSPSENQLEAMKRVQSKEPIGCIDTDRLMPLEQKFQANELQELFAAMHADVSRIFKSVMSDKAKKTWI